MGKLSTHVLDLCAGRPAHGVRIELWWLSGAQEELVATAITNADGRTDQPLLTGNSLRAGPYRLRFFVGEYFAATSSAAERGFLDVVPVEFIVSDAAASWHVPLLVTPWSYSTYRGS